MNTAHGDNPAGLQLLYAAAHVRGIAPSHLALFPMPNVDDIVAARGGNHPRPSPCIITDGPPHGFAMCSATNPPEAVRASCR